MVIFITRTESLIKEVDLSDGRGVVIFITRTESLIKEVDLSDGR